MAIISQLSTSNTFSQWLTGTQDLITRMNSLNEGGGSYTYYANTNLAVANNLTIGGDLTVTGNIVLDSIGFDDINANGSGSFANNLTVGGNTSLSGTLGVTGNTTLSSVTVNYGNFETLNVSSFVGSANTSVYANISYNFAYTSASFAHANAAFAVANTSSADALAFAIALG